MAVNKVVYGTTVLVDLTEDTVTAATLMQGYTAHDKSGALITGTATGGGGGDTYTRTVVVPQQTVTPNSSRVATFTSTEYFVDGEYYIVTYDGTEYIVTSETLWSNNVVLGDAQVVWTTNDVLYPFALITDGSARECYFSTTSQHTIKVERLEFVDGPLTIIPKSITANGTYNASSDNADGYSSVTVNVSGGMDMPVFTVVMDSEWTTVQSVTCSMTFAECTSYVNDNDTALVEMSAQGDSGTALYSASLYQGNPSELIFVVFLGGIPRANVSIMSNGTCSFTNQPSTVTTLTATANGTYTDSLSRLYSEVTVNVPSGQPTLQTKTVTPTTSQQTVQPDSGYDGLSQVTVNAIPSEYIVPSGNKAITQNGNNIDVAEYATVSVNVSGSSKNVQTAQSTTRVANTAYTKTASLTCSTAGKYDIYWDCFRSTTSGTSGSQLYIGGSAYGSANTTFSNHVQTNHLTGVTLAANQEVAVYARSRGSNYYAYCGQLTIVQTA